MNGLILKFLWPIALFFGVWMLLRWFEWQSVYYPTRSLEADPSILGIRFEDIDFVAEDGCRLHGWWIPAETPRGTVIFCHGNGGNISGRIGLAAELRTLGVNVFLFDYRGYGQSKGIPTEAGTYRDARAAFEVVRARYANIDRPPVVAYGRSLGGAVAVQLALDKPIRGLICESSFPSISRMAARYYPWLPVHWLGGIKYDSLRKISHLDIPKIFAHSREDDVIAYDLGMELVNRAGEPKRFVNLRGAHNASAFETTPEYREAVKNFLDEVLPE